jgi:hypothetical protein
MKEIEIILVESDFNQVATIRSNINSEFQDMIRVVKNYSNLLQAISEDRPQLVILGRFDKFNYFEIGNNLQKIQANLQIILISRDTIISDSYREALQATGVKVLASGEHEKLNQILDKLDRPISIDLSKPSINGEMMFAVLQEIISISSQHFGSLALGNYLRKSHTKVLIEFPSIQNWSVDHFGKLSCNESILGDELTDEDIQALRLWVQKFIEECERANSDFRKILDNSNTSLVAKYFLE